MKTTEQQSFLVWQREVTPARVQTLQKLYQQLDALAGQLCFWRAAALVLAVVLLATLINQCGGAQ